MTTIAQVTLAPAVSLSPARMALECFGGSTMLTRTELHQRLERSGYLHPAKLISQMVVEGLLKVDGPLVYRR